VIVGAVGLLAGVSMKALLQFEEVRMKFLLFPAVAALTSVLEVTPIFIGGDKIFSVPMLAHLFGVCEYSWFSSIVLPVMCVDTHIPLMIVFSVRAPHCFEMENVEVHVRLELLNQLHGKLPLVMCE